MSEHEDVPELDEFVDTDDEAEWDLLSSQPMPEHLRVPPGDEKSALELEFAQWLKGGYPNYLAPDEDDSVDPDYRPPEGVERGPSSSQVAAIDRERRKFKAEIDRNHAWTSNGVSTADFRAFALSCDLFLFWEDRYAKWWEKELASGYEDGWCRITKKVPTKDDGYVQISFHALNKAMCLHNLACARQNGPPPLDASEASHLCGRTRCFNPEHLVWESTRANNLRKGCPVWVDCPHEACGLKVNCCTHNPPCIKYLPGVKYQDFVSDRGKYIHL